MRNDWIIDIPSIVSSLGITGKEIGYKLKACCPFHKEKTPSWYIETNDPYRFHCFGCGESGNVFSLYSRLTGRDFYKDYGLDKSNYSFFATLPNKERVFGEVRQRKIDSIDGPLLSPFDNQEVMNYLLQRNIEEPITKEFLEFFNIQYTIKAEINRPEGNKDRGTFFIHRLVTPIVEKSIMIGLEGRSYNGGEPKVLYPKNSSVDTLLNIDNLDFNAPLYLAEGVFHLPTIFKFGFRNISCVFGANISPRQITLLRKFKKIVYFPDNDSAGENSIKVLQSGLVTDSLYICKVPYKLNKKGKPIDLGECTLKDIEEILPKIETYNSFHYNEIDPMDKKSQTDPSKEFYKNL